MAYPDSAVHPTAVAGADRPLSLAERLELLAAEGQPELPSPRAHEEAQAAAQAAEQAAQAVVEATSQAAEDAAELAARMGRIENALTGLLSRIEDLHEERTTASAEQEARLVQSVDDAAVAVAEVLLRRSGGSGR